MNTIFEEVNNVSKTENNLLSETRVELCRPENKVTVLGLLDSGATSEHIKRKALKNIPHKIEKVHVKVKGRYGSSTIKEVAIFDIKLIDFCKSKTVTVRANIDEDAIGRHDIILGTTFCSQLGLILNYKAKTIIWDDLSVPMQPLNSININTVTHNEDRGDEDLPDFMKRLPSACTKV